MKTVSSKIWTRVAVSIPYDDIHDTTIASLYVCMYKDMCTE